MLTFKLVFNNKAPGLITCTVNGWRAHCTKRYLLIRNGFVRFEYFTYFSTKPYCLVLDEPLYFVSTKLSAYADYFIIELSDTEHQVSIRDAIRVLKLSQYSKVLKFGSIVCIETSTLYWK